MKDAAIIIVNWNTKDLLRDCIQSVELQTKKYSYEIFVVDNNSPDGSADMVRNEFPSVKLIANTDNKGFAAANNQALRIAEAKYYLLLNPDTLVLENAIDKMIDYMSENKIEALTCKLLNPDYTLQKSVNNFFKLSNSFFENRFFSAVFENLNLKGEKFSSYWDHNSIREIDWAHGAVLMITANVLRQVGLLDEKFYIYAEEMDYYMRIKKAGFSPVFHPDIKIIHFGKSSSKQRRAEMFIQNYKSFYLFLKKHYKKHVYYLYRLRTLFYMILWITKYASEYLLKIFTGKKKDEPAVQLKVYGQTFLWHFNKESMISL